nr:DUF6481 family protein [uncultured Rhodopila sp.]
MPSAKRSTATKPAHARINFDDRIGAAAAAKKAVLERFLARPKPDDPAMQEQQAALKAIADARDARAAERKAIKDAEAARVAAEQAAQRTEEQRLAAEAKARAAAVEAERKAARDARYAARKARK